MKNHDLDPRQIAYPCKCVNLRLIKLVVSKHSHNSPKVVTELGFFLLATWCHPGHGLLVSFHPPASRVKSALILEFSDENEGVSLLLKKASAVVVITSVRWRVLQMIVIRFFQLIPVLLSFIPRVLLGRNIIPLFHFWQFVFNEFLVENFHRSCVK